MDFTKKVVLVTGGSRGIGRAIALRFGAEGANVIVNDIKRESAAAVATEILGAGGAAISCPCDVADEAAVDAMFLAAEQEYAPPDIVVNNAGLVDTQRHFLEGDSSWWRRIIDVNLTGVYLCCQRAAPAMAARGSGVIINLSSGGASRAHRGNAAYDAAKGGIEALTRAMALDLGPYGIRVNALVPGSVDTAGMDEATRASRGQDIPLARVGVPDELAGPAAFLASEDARYITGHMIYVDGGMLAQQRSASVDIFPLSRFPKR